ncbi:TRAP transporter substrate-binding protein [Undibacter mobilis]|uniref:C4-dicarboxylate ABC transporter substrate-binding protein n=1 Tax=Undibacter mobilis TaxID=2292256 RepID=A0A371BAV3_9BRAD|nr:TRAP transporter substrate-binding protein [Undibacter mobilis]RDV04672.1 C4-dicarboxylate ABC transporter substrate-binding protein [Undibacter mobilis]
MLKRLLSAAVFASLALANVTGAEAADPVTLRFSSFEPPQAFITSKILTPWAQKVTTESQGTLKIEMYPGGTLGRDPAAQLKLVLDGVADIAWIVPGYTPGRFDAATVVELPFVVPDAYTGSLALTRVFEKGLLKGGGFNDVKFLCVCANNPIFVNTTFPATKLEDLKGHNFRAAGPVSLNVVKSLGGVPIGGITGPALAENLTRGVIDATLNEWNALQTFRVLEVAKHQIILPLGSTSLMVIMNKAKYESLPPSARAALDKNSGEVFAKFFGAKFDENNSAVFETAKGDKKRTITVLNAQQQAPWKAAVQPAIEEWKKSTPDGDKLLKAFSDEVAAIQAVKK